MRGVWAFVKRKPVGGVCLLILAIFLILALFGSWITPYNPVETNIPDRMRPPSQTYWFGTDNLGRDVFSRVIAGSKLTYLISIVTTLLALFIGGGLAIISAYYGGRVDMLLQRVVDIFMAIPTLILAMAVVAALGPSVINVVISMAIAMSPRVTRVIRSTALSIRQAEYVMAARALGATSARVMWRHIAPNTFATAIILSAAYLGAIVLIEASLSFIGIGIPPPSPSWGRDLSDSTRYWSTGPWLGIFPGIALSLFVLAANLLGDALRDDLDPRLKRV